MEEYKYHVRIELNALTHKYENIITTNGINHKILDSLVCQYRNIMIRNAIKYIGIIVNINKRKPWANKNTINICKKTKRMYKLWKKKKRLRYYHIYKSLRQQRNNILNIAKRIT